jgi:outer membrane protein
MMFGRISKLVFIFILLFFSLSTAQNQERLTLTLDKSLEVAYEKNKSLLDQKEKISYARYKIDEARSNFFPQLSFQGSYTRLGVISSFQMPFSFQVVDSELKIVPTPMQLPMGFNDNYDLGLSLTQPLFTWGRIKNSHDIANLSYQASQESYGETKQKIKFEVTKSFYQIILLEELVKVREEARQNVEEHLKTVEARYKAGQASEFDLLRARVQLANSDPPLIQAKNSLELALNGFKNLLGLDLATEIKLEGELKYEPMEIDLPSAEKEALANRIELKSIYLQKQISRKALSIAKAGNRPTLAGFLNYDYKNPFNSVQKWDDDWNFGFSINLPLFDGFATQSRINQSKSNIKDLEVVQTQIEDGILLETRQAISNLNLAKENILSQKENVAQAKKSLEIAKVQYAEGMITSLEEMDTQLALAIAQTNYLQALADWLVAMAEYEKAIGRE